MDVSTYCPYTATPDRYRYLPGPRLQQQLLSSHPVHSSIHSSSSFGQQSCRVLHLGSHERRRHAYTIAKTITTNSSRTSKIIIPVLIPQSDSFCLAVDADDVGGMLSLPATCMRNIHKQRGAENIQVRLDDFITFSYPGVRWIHIYPFIFLILSSFFLSSLAKSQTATFGVFLQS